MTSFFLTVQFVPWPWQPNVASDAGRAQTAVLDKAYDVRVPLDIASSRKDDRVPPLHVACVHTENLQIFETLLKAPGGRQVLNMQPANCQSSSPLILAAKWNRLKVIKYLLDKGADATLEDDDGWTALKYASQSNYDYVRLNVAGLIETAEAKLHTIAGGLFLDILDEEDLEVAKESLLEEQEEEKKRRKKLDVFGADNDIHV